LDEPPDIRQSYLEMKARQLADDALAEIWGRNGLPRRWKVPWARWARMTMHRRIQVQSVVSSVALGTVDGRSVIVSGGWHGTLRVWDLATGTACGEPLRGHDGSVLSVALGTLDGRSVIVSGGYDGTLRVWDLATGTACGKPLRGHDGSVLSVALGALDGRSVIVSGGRDGTLRVWDLATGAARGEPLRGHDHGVRSVALGALDGRSVIVSGDGDGTLRVWNSNGVLVSSVQTGSVINQLAYAPPGTFAVGTTQGLLLLQFESKATMRPAAQWV
ncbi:MAG: hypothetical protein ACRDF6_14235, partial [bacterium]